MTAWPGSRPPNPGNLVAGFNAGALGARPYDLAVSANNASLYAAIGTGPGAAGAGNRIINFNTVDGTQAWNNNNLQGNGEAVEVIGTTCSPASWAATATRRLRCP